MNIRFKCAVVAMHAVALGIWSQPSQAATCYNRLQYQPMSNCRTVGGSYTFSSGQLMTSAAGNAFCPVTQMSTDTPANGMTLRTVTLSGWANPAGTTVQACLTAQAGGGVGGSCSAPQSAFNTVYNLQFNVLTFSTTDFLYLSVSNTAISGGSVNSMFGYRYNVVGQTNC